MRRIFFIIPAIFIALLWSSVSRAGVAYSTILGPNESVTGVRGDTGSNVLLTGSYQDAAGATQGLLYDGPLSPTNPSGYHFLSPTFSGETVTTSIFYGPDTSGFNPSLGTGNVRVVGSYQYSGSPTGVRNNGLIYQGSLSGTGTWQQIDVPSSLAGGPVANTIAHSTMGDLVVGNYDLVGAPATSGNAFIYNISTSTWTLFDLFGSMANETTAYGIWQNGIGSSSYTIAGGTNGPGPASGINEGFLVDYDSVAQAFSHLRLYSYMNAAGVLTHFEGITGTPDGFNLVGTTERLSDMTDNGAAFASVDVNPDGSFSEATWTPIHYPGSDLSTGNSIYQNTAMGIYTVADFPGIQSYIGVVVPEPPTYAMLVVGLVGTIALAMRRKKTA